MSQDNEYNPALLLRDSLAQINNEPIGKSGLGAFQTVFNSGDTATEFIKSYAKLLGYVEDIEKLISDRQKQNLEYIANSLINMLDAFRKNHSIDAVRDVLNTHVLGYLDGIVDGINYRMPNYNNLSEDNVTEYKDQLQSILDEIVNNAALDLEVRQYLNAFISEIITDLNNYAIIGSQALLGKLKMKLGDIFLSEKGMGAFEKSPQSFRRVFTVVCTIGALITGATTFAAHNLENLNKIQDEVLKLQDGTKIHNQKSDN